MVALYTRLKTASRSLDPAWRTALLDWAAVRLGLGVWAAWIWYQQLMPVTTGYFYYTVVPLLNGWGGALLGMWQRWDSIHYQAIAETHYSADHLSVFFPAFPLLARFLSQVSGLPGLAALLVLSSLATLFSMVLLYRIANDLFSEPVARRSLLCAVLFPTAFFYFGLYPQSLALLWILLAYDQARRGRWLAAGLAGLLAGLTHATAVALAAMLAVQVVQTLRGSRFSLRWIALLVVPALPLLGIALFLVWRDAMGFPSFIAIQSQSWERILSTPWGTLIALVEYFPANIGHNWVIALNTVMLAAAFASVVWGLRRLPLALSVYQIVFVLYMLSNRVSTDPLLSVNRYVLVLFPMYFALGSLRFGRAGQRLLFAVGLLGSLAISAMFFMWKWIG